MNSTPATTNKYQTDDVRVLEIKKLISPEELLTEAPITEAAAKNVFETRQAIHRVLHGADDRLLVIIGPCSIHDVAAAKEYAQQLQEARRHLEDQLLIVMRVYFEKPRTTVGWKGLINDPELNGSFSINQGLHLARSLLLDLATAGMPAGCEYLDMITPQYIADLVSWGAIGARHDREPRSTASLPPASPAPSASRTAPRATSASRWTRCARRRRRTIFCLSRKGGHSAIVSTAGNEDCHIILRGGNAPNYDTTSVDDAARELSDGGLPARIMVDFSHSNTSKQYERQIEVCRSVAEQLAGGDNRIFGVMVESHLKAGRQDLVPGKELIYGMSITDACIGWEDSSALLEVLAEAVVQRRLKAEAAGA